MLTASTHCASTPLSPCTYFRNSKLVMPVIQKSVLQKHICFVFRVAGYIPVRTGTAVLRWYAQVTCVTQACQRLQHLLWYRSPRRWSFAAFVPWCTSNSRIHPDMQDLNLPHTWLGLANSWEQSYLGCVSGLQLGSLVSVHWFLSVTVLMAFENCCVCPCPFLLVNMCFVSGLCILNLIIL